MIECNDQHFSFVQTIAGNMKGYSARQISDAKRALKLLKVMGHPSKQDFIKMIRGGPLKNCEVTEDDVKRRFDIWIADIETIKGKSTRKTPDRVKINIVALPAEILEKNKIVTLDIDIFFTNKIPFLLSLGQAIILNTIQHLTDRKNDSLLAAITLICNLYYRRGFLVKYINADNEFAHLKPDLLTMEST